MKTTVPTFNSDPTGFASYVTSVGWWVQAAQAEPGKMGVVLAMHLTGTAFQAAQSMSQADLLEATAAAPEASKAVGFPDGCEVPRGVCALISALNAAGFRFSPAEVASASLKTFEDCRRRPDERMADFVFRFDLARNKAMQHGLVTGDESTTAQILLLKADLSTEDRRKILGMLGSTTWSLDSVRQSLRLLFSADDAAALARAATFSIPIPRQTVNTANHHPLSNSSGSSDWRSAVEEVEVELRIPGEEVYVTRTVFIPKGLTKVAANGRRRPRWEPGCWNCGALDHFKQACPKPAVPGGHRGPVNGKVQYPVVDVVVPLPAWVCTHPFVPSHGVVPVGILDSACTSSVCGTTWLSWFETFLPEPGQLARVPQRVAFAFGRDVRTSNFYVNLPVWIQDTFHSLKVAVIPDDAASSERVLEPTKLPLLLSRDCHKTLRLVVDHVHDTAIRLENREINDDRCVLRGLPIQLVHSSGHLAIPLLLTSQRDHLPVYVTTSPMLARDSATLKKELTRLHRFYGHATDRLRDLIRRSGQESPQVRSLLTIIFQECEVCNSAGRSEPRPRACIPLAWDFQDCVSMDVFFIDSTPLLMLIDIGTRFCTVCVLTTGKSSASVIGALEQHWISIFGFPKAILADSAAETKSEEFLEYCA